MFVFYGALSLFLGGLGFFEGCGFVGFYVDFFWWVLCNFGFFKKTDEHA